jgi:transcriptional regulator with XRE-family HTH domain
MEKYSIIYDKTKTLCDLNNITVAKLERNLKFSEGSISKWKASKPSVDKLILIADYFDVSLDFITNRSLIRSLSEYVISNCDLACIQVAREHMSDEERKRMMSILKLTFPEAFNYL